MSLTYTTYVSQLANLMVVSSADGNFTTFLPGCIDYAEQRLYRDLNLQKTIMTAYPSGGIPANTRIYFLPSALLFPSGSPGNGAVTITDVSVLVDTVSKTPLTRSWKGLIDYLYPLSSSPSPTAVPQLYAVIGAAFVGSSVSGVVGDLGLVLGPTPGGTWNYEITGTFRPAKLSASVTSTILSNDYPDLFTVASMVFATGYQRDFGAQADDPRSAASWENQYQTLLKSAVDEQQRATFSNAAYKPQV